MLGIANLKERIESTDTSVVCPVKNCLREVARQKRRFLREDRFKCPDHNIYISRSTFEYANELDNLLWKDADDLAFLEKIKAVKRESRMARDNSEDAVSWNIFRFLEKTNSLGQVIAPLIGTSLESPEVMYWSYSQTEKANWSKLNRARIEFGETINRGSEPDLIVLAKNALLFIEAKVTAPNNTVPSDKNNLKKYQTGGANWFSKAFRSNYHTIAIDQKKYELMRLWLLGSWIAHQRNLDFHLINLTLAQREKRIEPVFKEHLHETPQRKFIRITWEDIYRQVRAHTPSGPERQTMLEYFQNKTIGYGPTGKLHKAFSIT